ncbi:MAG: HNH endonuclease [Actinomycetota bacterium]|nr:HNH endonuclease [Actinomycetota bacterium]
MFDTSRLEWPLPPGTAPPQEIIDCLVEDRPGAVEPVRWSEYVPDGLLADVLAAPADTGPEHREFEALERVGAWERVIAWAQARQAREMTSFMESATVRNQTLGAGESQAHDSAVAEVGLMLAASARTAACRVGDAWSLCTRLPATLAALEAGRITLAKARVIDTETLNLSSDHTAAVEEQVLAKARQQTPGQLRAATRRAVLSADPAAAQKRAERARRERGVRMWPEPDGMATLCAYLPAADAVGVYAVLDEYARRAGFAGDERSMDARRGDALVDLVLAPTGFSSEVTSQHTTPEPSSNSGTTGDDTQPCATNPVGCQCECGRCRRGGGVDVRITIPYTALLGADDQPGEIAGYGPIPAAVARDLAAGGTWRRILTDPASGRPVDYGTTCYRPPQHLTGLVITRDQTCQFPGCRVPAHLCDIDHSIPYNPADGTGPTSEFNLGPRCQGHHQVKQTPGWSVTQHSDGCTTWTTPTGHIYHSQPPPLTDPEPLNTPPAPDPDEPPPF